MIPFHFYHDSVPPFLAELAETPPMQRLKNVGMNCGCEYTAFPRFIRLSPYSRYTHSLGAGLITWHFTNDSAAAAAALLHDVATPAFAHTVDFLNGDYLLQESTETATASVIRSSSELTGVLEKHSLSVCEVEDYHAYPVADNDSPRLSADRLEYTLGNAVNYGFTGCSEVRRLYEDLSVCTNESGEPELAFSDPKLAEAFAFLALRCSRVYVSPEDRYSMQILSELLSDAIAASVISREDLFGAEPGIIAKLTADSSACQVWRRFRGLSRMVSPEEHPEQSRTVDAKKRRIDPLVCDHGRVSGLSPDFRTALSEFMAEDFTIPIAAV